MSHHASGPDFVFPRGDSRLDMSDFYVFGKRGDASKSDHHPECASVFRSEPAGTDNRRAVARGQRS
jgi:hypothetical protein